jgi:hypothetical protein
VYWLNSHDPDFAAKAQDICQLSLQALRFDPEGRLVICAEEKTGRQMLQRRYPTQPVQPGKPEKREHEYSRHGVCALLASCVVPTGHRGPPTPRDAALGLGGRQSQYPLELGRVSPGCRVV